MLTHANTKFWGRFQTKISDFFNIPKAGKERLKIRKSESVKNRKSP